jgi:hypothetical protein
VWLRACTISCAPSVAIFSLLSIGLYLLSACRIVLWNKLLSDRTARYFAYQLTLLSSVEYPAIKSLHLSMLTQPPKTAKYLYWQFYKAVIDAVCGKLFMKLGLQKCGAIFILCGHMCRGEIKILKAHFRNYLQICLHRWNSFQNMINFHSTCAYRVFTMFLNYSFLLIYLCSITTVASQLELSWQNQKDRYIKRIILISNKIISPYHMMTWWYIAMHIVFATQTIHLLL